jgi:hypothetical protein
MRLTGDEELEKKSTMGGRKVILWVVFFLTATLVLVNIVSAQNASIKHLSNKHQRYYDSLKNMNCDRVFPIYGERVYRKGFDIPFPFVIMINNFYGVQFGPLIYKLSIPWIQKKCT